MAFFIKQWVLPTWAQIMIGGFGILMWAVTALSTPQTVHDALDNVPFLSQPVPWFVMLGMATLLTYVVMRAGSSHSSPSPEVQLTEPANVGDAKPVDAPVLSQELVRASRKVTELNDEIWKLKEENATAIRTLEAVKVELDEAQKISEEYKAEIGSLEAEVKSNDDRCNGIIAEWKEVADELDAERVAHEQTKVVATVWENEAKYDIRGSRSFKEITPVQLCVAHNDMNEVRESLEAARNGILDVVTELGQPMLRSKDEKIRVIGTYFAEHRFRPAKNLYDKLIEVLNVEPADDYRFWLVHYYEAYNELRRTIKQMADFQECSLESVEGYVLWRGQDTAFLEGVKGIGVMYKLVEAINKNHGYPIPLPGD